MTDLDHRTLSIPLFVLGALFATAGAIGLAVDAVSDLATNNPAGVLATGGILLFGAFAVTALLHPTSDLAARRASAIPAVAALATVLLLAAVGGGAALGSTTVGTQATATGATEGATPSLAGLVGEEDFRGSVGGVATPLGDVGGASRVAHDLAVPQGAQALHVMLTWTAGTAGAEELVLRLETEEGDVLAEASGASELTLDLGALPDAPLRVVVALPEGGASSGQEYEARVAYYDRETSST